MRCAILWAFILALLPCLAQAQSSGYSKGHGYGYFGAGGRGDGNVDLHLGGGGDLFFNRHLGVGAEFGYLSNGCCFRDFESFGVFSPNLVARFCAKDSKTKLEPFVSAGYTRFLIGARGRNGVNFGGGLNWWFSNHVGFRVEVRDYVRPIPGGGVTYHYGGAHIGVTFR